MRANPAPEHTWGGRFAQRRGQLGLTQADIVKIAATLGTPITQQCISRFETGQVTPRYTTIEILARSCGTDVAELFPWTMRPTEPSPVTVTERRDKAARAKQKRVDA